MQPRHAALLSLSVALLLPYAAMDSVRAEVGVARDDVFTSKAEERAERRTRRREERERRKLATAIPAAPATDSKTSLPKSASPTIEINDDSDDAPSTGPVIEAGVEHTDHQHELMQKFDDLLEAALKKDARTEKLDAAVAHYRKPMQRAKVRLKDGVNILIPYKGFAQSGEGGDAITGEKAKTNSRSSAEYQRQLLIDQKEFEVTQSVMQLVSGLGDPVPERGTRVADKAMAKLKEFVGDQQASELLETVKDWQKELVVPPSVLAQETPTPEEQAERHATALKSAIEADMIVRYVTKQIHKYSHQSGLRRATGHVVNTALGAAALMPTVIGPAAALGITVFEVANGGSEEHKLLNEVYLGKRLENRKKTLSEQLHMALTNYDLAVARGNPVMIAYSELLVVDLCGASTAKKLFKEMVMKGVVDKDKMVTGGSAAVPRTVN